MRQSISSPSCLIQQQSALLGLLGLVIFAAACSGGDQPALAGDSGADTVAIVTTLYPLEYFAWRVGGESIQVVNLTPPGVEAHDFEPTPADILKLKGADLIIYNGGNFEPWMERALEAIGVGGHVVVEASRGLLGEAGDARHDPHVWLDPLKAVEQVRLIRDGLSEADPTNAGIYARNAAELTGELEKLDQQFQAGLANCRLRQFVTSHDAFGHLARRYGLEQVPITGLSPEAEPSPGDMADMADSVRRLGVGYLMLEPGISPRLARTLAGEVGAGLLTLHPLESLTPDEAGRGETYFSLMGANLRSLQRAMECSP